jgi:hypothetical protein
VFDVLLLPAGFRLSPGLITSPGAHVAATSFDTNLEAVPSGGWDTTRSEAEKVSLAELVQDSQKGL